MKNKPILIVPGEPKSIFFEIFFKSLKIKIFKSPIILICCQSYLRQQMKRFNFKKNIRILKTDNLKDLKLNNKQINLINVSLKKSSNSKQRFNLSQDYIKNSFEIAIKLIKSGFSNKIINGPINKMKFLKRKYLGVTEYMASKFNKKKIGMLIYNEELSVCPLTTHLPLKLVPKKITKKLIEEKIFIIDNFFKKTLNFKPKIAVTGLNPHCETVLDFNEDQKIVSMAIKSSKRKKINVKGPFPADTLFMKKNRKKYDVVLGMYHDQVLAPIKTLFEYDAINVTMGLPFLRVTPDHGPNEKMFNKNLSSPISLLKALKFLDKK